MSRRVFALLSAAILAATIVVIAAPTPASVPTTLYVDNGGGSGCDDSTTDSTTTPFCTIQAAVDAAVNGDTIQVAAGTYTGYSVYVVDVATDLTISGAGEGVTIIDGENTRGGVRVVDHSLYLGDLTIQNASSSGSGIGVAAYKDTVGSYISLIDVTVQDNSATYSGAGLYVGHSDADLLRVTMTGNDVNKSIQSGAGPGGAMAIVGGATVTITDSSFSSNTADTTGGAIDVSGDNVDLTITRSVFASNDADEDGGGIYYNSTGGTLSITDSTFDDNDTPSASPNGGGAIYVFNGTLEVTGSTFLNNDSGHHGGAIADATNHHATITNSTFWNNTAENNGGAIDSAGTLINVTVTGNVAANGGGISDNGYAALEIGSSIVYGNTDGGFAGDCNFTIASLGYNLIGATGAPCNITLATGDQVGTDPQLQSLFANGGPTDTMAIPVDSPARGAGNPAAPGSGGVACAQTDQRGFDRSLSTPCDSGAYQTFVCHGVLATMVGTNEPDTLTGTSSRDVIMGFDGNDTIDGKGGKDLICGGSGADDIYGSGGADKIYGENGGDTIFGGKKSDKIYGGKGNDGLNGGTGKHDQLFGGSGTDVLNGGAGNNDVCTDGETNTKCETIV